MTTWKKVEEIKVWQDTRNLVKIIYSLTKEKEFAHDYQLCNHIRKTAISVLSNIAEGFGRRSNLEFANFLNIAHGSLVELESQLYVAIDQSYLGIEKFNEIYLLCNEISKMILSLQKYLRNNKK